MSREFKVGDRVKIVDNQGLGGDLPNISLNKTYTILAFDCDGSELWFLNDAGYKDWWSTHRFKLANSIIKSKLTKLLQQEGEV